MFCSHAQQYRELGFSVIPMCGMTPDSCMYGDRCPSPGKHPLIKWKVFQNERADEAQINQWWKQWPLANIGIVTGSISNLAVVDIEAGGSLDDLVPTVIAKTGGGGWHYYYRLPANGLESSVRFRELTDSRAEGGYVVAPPSSHKSGGTYEWAVDFSEAEPAEFPVAIIQEAQRIQKIKHDTANIVLGVAEGERNSSAASLAGKLLTYIPPRDRETLAWPLMVAWNNQNRPPLEVDELKGVYDSISARHKKKDGDLSSETDTPFEILSWDAIKALELPPIQWRINHLIPSGAKVSIAGRSGHNKSWLAMGMACAMASGRPFLGCADFNVVQSKVLYIENEASMSSVRERGYMLDFDAAKDNLYLAYINKTLNLNDDKAVNKLYEQVKELGIEVIFVDPFISTAGGIESASADDIRAYFNRFRPFINDGLSVIFIDHVRKGDSGQSGVNIMDLFGSQDKVGSADLVFMVQSKKKEDGSETIEISQMKCRLAQEYSPFAVNKLRTMRNNKPAVELEYAGLIDTQKKAVDKAQELILELLGKAKERLTREQVTTELLKLNQVGKSNIEKALEYLRETGEIQSEKVERTHYHWLDKSES